MALKTSGNSLSRSPSVHRDAGTPGLMLIFRLAILVLLASLPTLSARAADAPHRSACLTKAEQRAAVAANRAISLAQAIKLLREHRQYSEVVRARLCRHEQKLVYVLTLLGRNGKVVTATIDAVNGEYHVSRSVER
ncbi:MAG TPA: PepSY domain-containing protein [Pseudolabrys sp.]|nr:PepSY domain-containing protein [Pseudolabrys sp.]